MIELDTLLLFINMRTLKVKIQPTFTHCTALNQGGGPWKLKRWAQWDTKVMFVLCKWRILITFVGFCIVAVCRLSISAWLIAVKHISLVLRCYLCLRLKRIHSMGHLVFCLLIDFPCSPHTCLNNPFTLILPRPLKFNAFTDERFFCFVF